MSDELAPRARAFRLVHAMIAVVELSALAYIWACAAWRRRDRWLALAIGTLCVEGIGIIIGRGNCPLGPLQRKLGDQTPLFALVLPPRAAKAAFPVLLAVTLTALVAVAILPTRERSLASRARPDARHLTSRQHALDAPVARSNTATCGGHLPGDRHLRVRTLSTSDSVPEDSGSDTGRNGRCTRRGSSSVVHGAAHSVRERAAVLAVTLLVAVGCSTPRDATAAVVATTLGHMPPPAGTALVEETYEPRHDAQQGFVTSRNCGRLLRVFATNDPDGFLRAVLDAARNAGWQVPTVPNVRFGVAGAVRLRGERTVVSLVFYDYDDPLNQPLAYASRTESPFTGPMIDTTAWRFLARLQVRDAFDSGWSDCVEETRINP